MRADMLEASAMTQHLTVALEVILLDSKEGLDSKVKLIYPSQVLLQCSFLLDDDDTDSQTIVISVLCIDAFLLYSVFLSVFISISDSFGLIQLYSVCHVTSV